MTQQQQSDAYDMVDRYLRNNMDDVDYEIYSQALDVLAEGCAQATQPVQVPAGSIRLWDAQWVSIVNHDNAYNGWSTNDAVNHAVRMTERYIAANVAQNNLPPLPAAQEVK